MSEFYVIKLINQNGERGYLIDSPDGIKIVNGGVHTDITQFETEKDASSFIRERKIERGGVKAYVRSNADMIKDAQIVETQGISRFEQTLYCIENQDGWKLFYDSKIEGYYFKNVEAGFPVWKSEEEIMKFCSAADLQQRMVFCVEMNVKASDRCKKLVQVYGKIITHTNWENY